MYTSQIFRSQIHRRGATVGIPTRPLHGHVTPPFNLLHHILIEITIILLVCHNFLIQNLIRYHKMDNDNDNHHDVSDDGDSDVADLQNGLEGITISTSRSQISALTQNLIVCSVCEMAFETKGHLRRHVKNVHAEDLGRFLYFVQLVHVQLVQPVQK